MLKYESKLKHFRRGLRSVGMEELKELKLLKNPSQLDFLKSSFGCIYEAEQVRWTRVKNYTNKVQN